MPGPGEVPDPIRTENAIARGDHLARIGDWTGAVDQWRNALNGPNAAEASQRIRWFVRETNNDPAGSTSGGFRRRHAYRYFFGAALISAVGTAVTLAGIGRSGADSTLIAAAAWILFGIAMALSLAFARSLGTQTDRQTVLTFGDRSVAAATEVAARLDRVRDPDVQVVQPGPTPVRKWPRR